MSAKGQKWTHAQHQKRDRYSITSSAPGAGDLAIFVEISRNARPEHAREHARDKSGGEHAHAM